MESTQGARTEASSRHAGILLAGAAALTVVTMSQHPSGMHGSGAVNTAVHVSMMVWLSLMLVGFASFAARRGLTQLLVLSGFVAYAVSCIAHLGAATINGFIVPALAARPQPPGHDIFLLCWQANQALARLGVVATGVAYVAWAVHALMDRTRVAAWVAIAGLAAGVLPVAALALGLLKMDVHGALVIYATHAAWAIIIGTKMARGTI